jgi:SNF2 family DNA or RNA helicase
VQIVDNHTLVVRTRYPARITETIKNSKLLQTNGEVTEVAVKWGLEEAQVLRKLNVKNVPSPIKRDYKWPGLYKPMSHQIETASFLTLYKRAFCFNEQGTGKTASAIWASDYLLEKKYIKRVLIVCPLSIMQSAWQADLFKFALHRSVNIAYGNRNKRKEIISSISDYVVINFDGLEIVKDEIKHGGFDLIIIDEANAYKNVRTQRFKAMKEIMTHNTWMWMMTGTPAAQSPLDAYGLAKMCVPDTAPMLFGGYRESVMQQLTRFKWVPKPSAESTVHKILQPAIRFTKAECLDLPEVTTTTDGN